MDVSNSHECHDDVRSASSPQSLSAESEPDEEGDALESSADFMTPSSNTPERTVRDVERIPLKF